MKRYDLVTNYRAGSSIEEMEPSDDGEWVRWEDIEAWRRGLMQRWADKALFADYDAQLVFNQCAHEISKEIQ